MLKITRKKEEVFYSPLMHSLSLNCTHTIMIANVANMLASQMSSEYVAPYGKTLFQIIIQLVASTKVLKVDYELQAYVGS